MSLLDHLLLGAKVEGSGSSAHADGRKYAFNDVFAIAAAEGGGQRTWARSRDTMQRGPFYTFIARSDNLTEGCVADVDNGARSLRSASEAKIRDTAVQGLASVARNVAAEGQGLAGRGQVLPRRGWGSGIPGWAGLPSMEGTVVRRRRRLSTSPELQTSALWATKDEPLGEWVAWVDAQTFIPPEKLHL